jgi:hypothetical protein
MKKRFSLANETVVGETGHARRFAPVRCYVCLKMYLKLRIANLKYPYAGSLLLQKKPA